MAKCKSCGSDVIIAISGRNGRKVQLERHPDESGEAALIHYEYGLATAINQKNCIHWSTLGDAGIPRHHYHFNYCMSPNERLARERVAAERKLQAEKGPADQ
jgi:hypothetical protein